MKVIAHNDDPPHTDDKMEALFDEIYEMLAPITDEDYKERLSVWIADKMQAAFTEGYAQGCADSKKALEDGYLI